MALTHYHHHHCCCRHHAPRTTHHAPPAAEQGLSEAEAVEMAWGDAQSALTNCPNGCGRTFLPDRISKHLGSCITALGDHVEGDAVLKSYGLQPRA